MLRALAVAALLAMALPAEARPMDLPGPAQVGQPIPEAPVGSPLLRENAEAWLPILRDHGYARASQAMSQPEPEEDVEAEEEDDQVQHWFMPLGDANGNGRDDVVLASETDDTITYQALDGGRVSEVLWTFEAGEGEYAYIAGDIDEDGVHDLERLADPEEGRSTQSDNGEQWEQRTTVTILSGRDLAVLTELQLVARGSYESTQPEPLPLMGESTWTDRYSYEYVSDLDGQPGLARVTWTMESHERDERIIVTMGQSYTFNFSATIAVLDMAGALRWAHDEPGWDLSYGGADVTQDDVPDLLMRSGDSYGYSYSGLGPHPPIDPPVDPPIPIFPSEEETRRPYQVRLLDGASGEVVWDQAFGNATYSYTSWLGDLYGNGPVLEVVIIDFGSFDSYEGISFQTFLLDGATGEVLHQEASMNSFAPLGDANGDGRDDILSLDFGDSTLKFEAMDGDFKPIWDLKLKDDDFAGLSDVDADGVLDVLAWLGDNLTVHDGTNGKPSWAREEPRMVDYDITPGIVSEQHSELAVLLSDALDHQDVTDYKADLLVLRGSDGASLWRKPLYDPTDYTDVSGQAPWLWVGYAGDLNGDGARDFIVELEHGFDMVVCDDDGCREEQEDEDDKGQPLSITLLVDGATGATIARFDDMELSGKIKKVDEAPVDIKPASQEIQDEVSGQDAPGFALYVALAAVGVALALRRMRVP